MEYNNGIILDVLQTLGIGNGEELFDSIIIADEDDPKIMIEIGEKYYDLKVYIEGHDEFTFPDNELTQ